MQWWDNGEAELSAMGAECNYTVACEFGRGRLWKVTQTSLEYGLLKATWAENCDKAKAQAEAWEEAHGNIDPADRGWRRRMLHAARNTRPTRTRLARLYAAQEKRERR
jgi:hypothetical protein